MMNEEQALNWKTNCYLNDSDWNGGSIIPKYLQSKILPSKHRCKQRESLFQTSLVLLKFKVGTLSFGRT